MNREIKVRAYYKKYTNNKYIVDGEYTLKDILERQIKFDLSRFKFVEFTGLKDKNGKEIYEGDIMYVAGQGNSYVKYFEDVACFGLITNDEQIEMFSTDGEGDITKEVIGNIYENKDLLK